MRLSFSALFTIILSHLMLFVQCFPQQYTFELPNGDELCFYEKLNKLEKYSLFYQELNGYNDISVVISDPGKTEVVKRTDSTHENIEFSASTDGDYSICFYNSPGGPRRVFFELRGEDTLKEEAGDTDVGPSTMIENLAESIHEHLSISESYQSELRTKLASDRAFALELHSFITNWSIVVCITILAVTLLRIVTIKRFFKDQQSLRTTKTWR